MYPKTDVVYYGNRRHVEYDFVLAPGSRPEAIRMRVRGAEGLRLTDRGEVEIGTNLGPVALKKPLAYQQFDGERREVKVRYRIEENRDLTFELGPYDSSRPLTIDPTVVYATGFGGGTSGPTPYGIARDSDGNIYVVGSASIPNLGIVGGQGISGGVDVYVAKFNPAGTALLFSTFVGGGNNDWAFGGIKLDASGNMYVGGYTQSTDFPLVNAAQGAFAGGTYDAFLFRLNSAGTSFGYSTYWGGSDFDWLQGLAVSPGGEAVIVGYTHSGNFPVLAAAQSGLAGFNDAYAARFSGSGAPVFSTYLGGSASDYGYAVALDPDGNAYVAGATNSVNFPVTVGVVQSVNGGGGDAFLTKFSPAGARLLSTFHGGSGVESAYAVAWHTSGVYLGGYAGANMPVTAGVVGPLHNGGNDGFVVKFTSTFSARSFSTYIGGGKDDSLNSLAVEETTGNVYFAGSTHSADFPAVSPLISPKRGATSSIIRSTDGGMTWASAESGAGACLTGQHMITTSANTILAACGGLLLRREAGSSTWEEKGIRAAERGLDRSGTTIYAMANGSVHRSTDDGQTFELRGVTTLASSSILAVSPANPNLILVGSRNSGAGVARSVDGGATWTIVAMPVSTARIQSISFDPLMPSRVYAGAAFGGVYRSDDGGQTWAARNTGLSASADAGQFIVSTTTPNSVLVTVGGAIFSSTDAGATWTLRGASGVSSYWLIQDPSAANTLYSVGGSFAERSTDGGATWTPVALPPGISATGYGVIASGGQLFLGGAIDQDPFAGKLSSNGTALTYSTLLGTSISDTVTTNSIATDSAGNLFLVLQGASWATTPGAFDFASQFGSGYLIRLKDTVDPCTPALHPGNQLVGASAFTVGLWVIAPSGCAWTATSNQAWATLFSDASASGVGFPQVNIAQNSGPERTATITVGSQSINIVQTAAGCNYVYAPSALSVPAAGGSFVINVSTTTGCRWRMQPRQPSLVTVTSGAEGVGSGSFTVAVQSNSNPVARSLSLSTVTGGTFFMTQAAFCGFAVTPGSTTVPRGGGTIPINVVASSPLCTWSSSVAPPASYTTTSGGTGSGSIVIAIAPNSTAAPRNVSFTVAGTLIVIAQGGGPLDPTSGVGATRLFSAQYTDSTGANRIRWTQLLFAVAPDGGGQSYCFVHYDVFGNGLWLYDSTRGFFAGPIAPGTASNSLQDSVCAQSTLNSSAVISGTTLTLNVSLIFKTNAVRNVYMRQMNADNVDSGWIQRGTWTLQSAPTGTPSGFSPTGSLGGGTPVQFTLTYPDTPGFPAAPFGW
ncbi:MAG: SBBP repeat-containing protein, partial [Bryobacteraceae bacterium]|nr:SBBP repeat-containing protein [Bryobacteraceae bacterium]